jgi:arsenate reductase
MTAKPLVLILCTGNSCRSQMAEAFLRKYAGMKYQVASAGTEPQPHVHPLAVRVMSEAGLDISAQRPKDLREFFGRAPVRHLILVCDRANAACPAGWPGPHTRQHLPFDDPAHFSGAPEQILAEFRRVRDQIDAAMKSWAPPGQGQK